MVKFVFTFKSVYGLRINNEIRYCNTWVLYSDTLLYYYCNNNNIIIITLILLLLISQYLQIFAIVYCRWRFWIPNAQQLQLWSLLMLQKINIILTVSQPYYNSITFCFSFFSYVLFLLPVQIIVVSSYTIYFLKPIKKTLFQKVIGWANWVCSTKLQYCPFHLLYPTHTYCVFSKPHSNCRTYIQTTTSVANGQS